MSFSSLLNEISKDKKLKQKITPISNTLSNKKSVKTAKSLSQSTKSSMPFPVQKQTFSSKSPTNNNIDPSVIRLKEARRKEKERLEALKNAKKPLKNASSNKRPTISKAKPIPIARQSDYLSPVPSKSKQNNYSSKPNLPNPLPKISVGPKLSFKELMKQAESVDSKQLVINPIKKVQLNQKLEPSRALKAIKISRKELPRNVRNFNEHSKSSNLSSPLPPSRTSVPRQQRQISNSNKIPTSPRYKQGSTNNNDASYSNSKVPVGPPLFAKPNPELLNRLKNKKNSMSMSRPSRSPNFISKSSPNYSKKTKDDYGIDATDDDEFSDQGYGYSYGYDDYEDDDGFIVNDEDDYFESKNRNRDRERERRKFENDRRTKEKGYDRNEIWEIFNRGKKRNFKDYHDDDDDYDDDMEATGTEILEDEERTLKQAKVDDLREQRLLEKRQLEKKKLLAKKKL